MKKRLIIVLGSGGHTAQMLKLVDLFGKEFEYEYIVAREDELSEKKIKIPGKIHKIKRTREIGENIISSLIKQFKSIFEVWEIIKDSNAEGIISCGPHISIPICFVGKLFRKKIIFLESWSRVYKKSGTGKIIYKFSDLFFVQWQEMKKIYPAAVYAGRLK
jgi:beta-1,4-N-acetylglucosaminyltransferase